MSENIAAIRRESVKYECIADQTEGEVRKLNLAKAITFEALADILEDPKKRAELFRIATGKPRLQVVSDNTVKDEPEGCMESDRTLVLLKLLMSEKRS